MEGQKYLHSIPPSVLADKTLLKEWLKDCVETELFGLTIEVASDDSLLLQWTQDLLSGRLPVNEEVMRAYYQNFIIDNPEFLNVQVDKNLFIKNIEKWKEIQSFEKLIKKDNLLSGLSVEELDKLKETREKDFALKLEETTNHYDSDEKLENLTNLLPFVENDFNNFKKGYYSNKFNQLIEIKSPKEEYELEKLGCTTIEYNKNHWNKECHNLFMYLMENYEKKGKIKFVNIFYYLTNHIKKEKYAFNQTIDIYKHFIISKYNVELKTFRTAQYEFKGKEVPILNGLESDYSSQK